MKTSTLYRRAAEMVDSGEAYYGCTAIYMLKRNVKMSEKFFTSIDHEALAFAYMFQNNKYKDTLYRGCFGDCRNKKNQELRVLALCLMAAIVESEE
jgi:hypothetical protein